MRGIVVSILVITHALVLVAQESPPRTSLPSRVTPTSGQTPLPDGTTLLIHTDYANVEKLPGYDQARSRAQGALIPLVLEFTTKTNPQLNFIVGRQADSSDFSLLIGETGFPPIAVGGPADKLDRVQFAGYQYQTDDGRMGYQTFLSGKKELLLLFDVPSPAPSGSRTLSINIRLAGKATTLKVPLK